MSWKNLPIWLKRSIYGGFLGIIYFIITLSIVLFKRIDPVSGGNFMMIANIPSIILIYPLESIFNLMSLNNDPINYFLVILGDFIIGAILYNLIIWGYNKIKSK